MGEVMLNREAATALLKEARREFENGAHEILNGDESQKPIIEACVEIIGRLNWPVERAWPQERTELGSRYDRHDVEFEFTSETLDWIEAQCPSIEEFVIDLDRGANVTGPGDIAEQVYLLHVLRSIVAQREAVPV